MKYKGLDKSPKASAWRREQIAKMAAAGAYAIDIARAVGITERAVLKIAQSHGIEMRAHKSMGQRHARIDLNEYLTNFAERMQNSVERANDMLNGVIDEVDPEVRAQVAARLVEVSTALSRMRGRLRGKPHARREDTVGRSRWVNLPDDDWDAFKALVEANGQRPGAALAGLINDYMNKEQRDG